jgi:hypothetical protein
MYRYWWESQKGNDHYEDLDVGGWIILKGDHRQDWMLSTGLIWLRIGISGGLL